MSKEEQTDSYLSQTYEEIINSWRKMHFDLSKLDATESRDIITLLSNQGCNMQYDLDARWAELIIHPVCIPKVEDLEARREMFLSVAKLANNKEKQIATLLHKEGYKVEYDKTIKPVDIIISHLDISKDQTD